jgi:Putative ABC exporter
MFGPAALRLLLRLKLRGAARAQLRRLRSPRNWIFLLVGVGLFAIWGLYIVLMPRWRGPSVPDPESDLAWTSVVLFALALLTLVSSFNHRGLYLPRQEIELVFSAPIERSDLVRYRLSTNLLRSLVAGLFIGMGTALRMPHPLFAFAGTLAALLSLPILGQATAILLGDAENRWTRLVERVPARALSLGGALGLVLLLVYVATGQDGGLGLLLAGREGEPLHAQAWFQAPLTQALLLPTRPWALAINAETGSEFLRWFGLCALIWLAAFELTARLPVDFRELSLATSADVARRLQRLRRGGAGVGGSKAERVALSWQVPWLLGRGPFGAIAWLKFVAMMRKARGTVLFSVLVVAFVAIGFPILTRQGVGQEGELVGACMIAAVGSMYLAAGLRFDFRQDLELMDRVKTWPVAPARIFLATILPEVLLISILLSSAILVRSACVGFQAELLPILWFQPLATGAWIAVDNAVYLYAPVRFTPGQEGALQHMGRSLLLMVLRLALLGVALLAAGGPALALVVWADEIGLESGLARVIALSWAWLVLLAVDVALVYAGGWVLRRFDVARDRG